VEEAARIGQEILREMALNVPLSFLPEEGSEFCQTMREPSLSKEVPGRFLTARSGSNPTGNKY
jgi:hypothetical protein